MKNSLLLLLLSVIIACSHKPSGLFNNRFPAQNSPEVIFYPGTFDPFHLTHYEEVNQILGHHPKSKFVILPIEKAYYFPPTHFARIFDYANGQKMIEKAFEGNSQVVVSSELRSIDQNVFQTLIELGQKYQSKDVAFLIGTDVLDLWSNLPGFDELTKNIRLIVSKDPKDTETFERLSKHFQSHPKIEFIDTQVQGLRSREIKMKLVQDTSDFSYLPMRVAGYLKENPRELEQNLNDLMQRLTNILNAEFEKEISPELRRSGLQQAVVDLITDNKKIRSLFYQCRPNDPLSVSWLTREIQMNFKTKSELQNNPHLFNQMYKFFNSGELSGYFASPVVRRNSEMYRVLAERLRISVSSSYQGLLSRPINILGRYVWAIGQEFFKRAGSLKKSLFDIPIDRRLLSLSRGVDTGDLEITVYRGVRPHENMEKLLSIWQEEGFLSKVALDARLHGANVEDSIAESEKYLKQKGIQKSLVDHIVGDWSVEAPFISTSFDKLTAAKYAGKGGYVFTMKVKLSDGYFLNDLAFWQNTPWQQTGNPVEYLHEFVVPHQIKPEMIVASELITEEPPPTAIHASSVTIGKLLKAIPWKVSYGIKSCPNIFRKINAPRIDVIPLD